MCNCIHCRIAELEAILLNCSEEHSEDEIKEFESELSELYKTEKLNN